MHAEGVRGKEKTYIVGAYYCCFVHVWIITYTMELKELLHMKEGDGEFSYAQNSTIQQDIASLTKPIVESAIRCLLSSNTVRPCEVLTVTDLGCGVGPVPLAFLSRLTENVQTICQEMNWGDDERPEIQLYMNDLPSNDFDLLFKDLMHMELPKTKNGTPGCYFMGVPGSYYGRLFPRNSLHFVHSNCSLHWLSQVPPDLYDNKGVPMNKGCITLSNRSPPAVAKAYLAQFQRDWTLFLRCRSDEVMPNGHVLITVPGRPSKDLKLPVTLDFLDQAIASLVTQELIKEEEVDKFEFPCYCPTEDEIQDVIQSEGSFEIKQIETVHTQVSGEAQQLAKALRAISESLFSSHFGGNIWDMLYNELLQVIQKDSRKRPLKRCFITTLLTRKM